MALEGKDAIAVCRRVAGATNPEEAHRRSIRGAFGRITQQGVWENLVHVSSDRKEARREIKLWFKGHELLRS
jgi:nucleoside-diphosphate kinase